MRFKLNHLLVFMVLKLYSTVHLAVLVALRLFLQAESLDSASTWPCLLWAPQSATLSRLVLFNVGHVFRFNSTRQCVATRLPQICLHVGQIWSQIFLSPVLCVLCIPFVPVYTQTRAQSTHTYFRFSFYGFPEAAPLSLFSILCWFLLRMKSWDVWLFWPLVTSSLVESPAVLLVRICILIRIG